MSDGVVCTIRAGVKSKSRHLQRVMCVRVCTKMRRGDTCVHRARVDHFPAFSSSFFFRCCLHFTIDG